MFMRHIGLTGNIATGKSYAAGHFASLGARIINADHIAHELLEYGTDVYQNVLTEFGAEILRADGSIDRKRLGEVVFSSEEKRRRLNAITHPAVRNAILREIAAIEKDACGEIIIVEAALLVETGGYKEYDGLIVTVCDPATQLYRLMARDGLTESAAQSRIASQLPMKEKVRLADYVIDTSGTPACTREQVEAIYRKLLLKKSSPENSL